MEQYVGDGNADVVQPYRQPTSRAQQVRQYRHWPGTYTVSDITKFIDNIDSSMCYFIQEEFLINKHMLWKWCYLIFLRTFGKILFLLLSSKFENIIWKNNQLQLDVTCFQIMSINI